VKVGEVLMEGRGRLGGTRGRSMYDCDPDGNFDAEDNDDGCSETGRGGEEMESGHSLGRRGGSEVEGEALRPTS
jgi:hypothetical protein